jgi:cytochrome d ubiquinol oxidase subunit II
MTFTLPHIVAGVMVLSLNAYILLGGADFGGGVWDLVARGPRRDEQRALIANAIGPIWEANHVWLILVVVLLFTCFPRVYAHLATELHVPITLMLVGIVLRGSAFTFRTYDRKADTVQRRWGATFSVASLLTPVLLGLCVGTVAAGAVPLVEATAETPALVRSFSERFLRPWTTPFPLSVGLLALALFAFLAATYLTVEAREGDLQEDFRRRGLVAAGALFVAAAVTIVLARRDAPLVYRGLTTGTVALAMHGVTAVASVTAIVALVRRRFVLARTAAAAQASFILWGWAWSQFPFMLPPDRTIEALAAPRVSLQWVLGALAAGTVILLPSFAYLFRVFRPGTAFDDGNG